MKFVMPFYLLVAGFFGYLTQNVKTQNEIVYAVPVMGTESVGLSPVMRHIDHQEGLVGNFVPPLYSTWGIFHHGMAVSNDGNAIGYRKAEGEGKFGDFVWMTYSEVIVEARYFGSGLLSLNALKAKKYNNLEEEIKILGIYSRNCVEWVMTDLAANGFGMVLAPLYDTGDPELLSKSIALLELEVMVVAKSHVEKAIKLAMQNPLLKILIVIGGYENRQLELARENGISLYSFKEVSDFGRTLPRKPEPKGYHGIHSIHFTSGTTGMPKGAILTNGNWISVCAGSVSSFLRGKSNSLSSNDVYLSYLPMAHIFERTVNYLLYYHGGSVGFFSGDIALLKEDAGVLKPTIFVAVPRVINRIYDAVLSSANARGGLALKLFNKGLTSKLKSRRIRHGVYDALIFKKIRNMFGGRIRFVLSGAAKLDTNIQLTVRALLSANIVEGYGMTEALAAFCAQFDDETSGHVGGPIPSVEYRLLSVKEMGYDANTSPRQGELLIRGHSIFKGYLGNEKDTTEGLVDGWLHTGDIAEILENGAVKIIDRRKNMFKLSQGEYISPEKIENVLISCSPMVTQAFVTGLLTESFLVAILVIDESSALHWNQSHGFSYSFAELLKSVELKEYLLNKIDQCSKESKLLGFERVRKIYLISELFSVENGLLTPTFKIIRHKASKAYSDVVARLYQE